MDNTAVSRWYVLRDLRRSNVKEHAYQLLERLAQERIKIFTPLVKQIVPLKGKKELIEKPCINDLLFVYANQLTLDPLIERVGSLPYRYVRGGRPQEPMVIREKEMNQFITIVQGREPYQFYKPEEVTPAMYGQKILMVGGWLDGYQGRLMTTRGSRVRRLIVELEGLLAVGVAVHPDYIQIEE